MGEGSLHEILQSPCSLRMTESGRSLVEMLGMLAIMGILGLTGVKAYTYAMNKHRANELINEAQKRASVVAMQIASGRDSLSIGEFQNPTGYIFGVERNPYNANQFNITINAVDADICTQIKAIAGTGTPLRVISNNCTTLTFNNDLSTTTYASDAQTAADCAGVGTWCTKGDNGAAAKCSDGADCCTGVTYDNQCQTCASATGTVSNKANNTPCDFDGDEVNESVCLSGVCVDPNVTNGAACSSNADCGGVGSGYYCKITYDAGTNLNVETVNTSATECYKNLYQDEQGNPKGTCTVLPRPAARLTSAQKALLTEAGFAASVVISPNNQFTWWNANNWCQAQGKRLLNVSEIDCHRKTSNPATNNTVVQAGETQAYCCKDGEECLQENWDTTLWNGKNILAGKAEEVAKYADKIVALRKVYGATAFWTASPYNVESQNSCNGFVVYANIGYVRNYARSSNVYALCE